MIFYSHLNKELRQHLCEVRDLALLYCPKKYKKAVEIAALSHDFGKFTTYFQDYLWKKKKDGNLHHHGFISALFGAFWALKEWGDDSFYPLIIYSVIHHHHGNLTTYDDILPKHPLDFGENMKAKVELAYKQIENIKSNLKHIQKALRDVIPVEILNEFVLNFCPEDYLVLLLKRNYQFKMHGEGRNDESYFLHQFVYSSLIAADKLSAADLQNIEPAFVSYAQWLKARKSFLGEETVEPGKNINAVRTEIFDKVQKSIDKYCDKGKVFTITSPTGTGKTLTGFCAAAKLNEYLGGNRQIIYILPFTSIIDQNFEVINKLLAGTSAPADLSHILKHHHLSYMDSNENEDNLNYSSSGLKLLIENWPSGVVITTFVQFFESILSHRNRMLKKLHRLRDSIILIDEIQALDVEYYVLVEYVLGILCKHYDARVILMTATRPLIFIGDENNELKAVELLSDYPSYYKYFNRTSICIEREKIEIEGLINQFEDLLSDDASCLLVFNTINSSLEAYKKVNEILLEKNIKKPVFYLSTNIVPAHRKQRIKEIKECMEKGEKVILISTQVVEAGVDLDFDIVIRDFAPLDSIIQCAGRCNRSGLQHEPRRGKVYLCNLVDDKGHMYAHKIYGKSNLLVTQKVLENYDRVEEKNYIDLIENYYKLLKEKKSSQISDELIDAMKDFAMEKGKIASFSLIKNNPGYIDVLFRLNEEVEKAYQEFWEVIKIKDLEARTERYLKILPILTSHTISMPAKYAGCFEKKPLGDGYFFSLPPEGKEEFYDESTGFKRDKKDEAIFF
ncbi:MAG: CRISPR-associated helicase Cas3' [Clostridia bacterium]|nr:CRISPR-associated helicase Cas3' [Clostridia bacterium]